MSSPSSTILPSLAASSPASATFATVFPETGMRESVRADNLAGARVALLIGGVVFAGIMAMVVLSIKSSMTRNFDMTVRKLAGLK